MAFVIAALFFSQDICHADELSGKADSLNWKKDQVSYSIGYQIGGDLKNLNKGIDPAHFLQGMRDAQAATPAMGQEEMRTTLVEFKKEITAAAETKTATGQQAARKKNTQADSLFLEENRQKEGVVTLASGLQYKIIKNGNGRRPVLTDFVTVHYLGKLIDGSEFYSTHRKGEPETVLVGKTVPGWQEALLLMPEGSRWQLFIPHHLAYGERGPLADRTVIFDLELIAVK